jgi:hypothetical protein
MPSEKIEARIGELEDRLSQIDLALADPAVWPNVMRAAELNAQREDAAAEKAELEEEWLRRAE